MIRSLIDVIANPIYPTIVLLLFFSFFVGMIYFVVFKWGKENAQEAAMTPLDDGEIHNE